MGAKQIKFFRKNWADYERATVSVVASEGDGASSILDRSNRTAWGTTGSADANNTTIEVDMGDLGWIDSILLLKHNFKNYQIQYWDDVTLAYVDFATPIHPTSNTDASSYHSFPQIMTSKIKITIFGTQVADADKYLYQFIATNTIGTLEGWPIIRKPVLSRNLSEQKMLSGKQFILQNIGFYSVTLTVANWSNPADLAIVEALFGANEGFLVWPCGGDQDQFSSVRQGYRFEDIFLVRCKNEFSPEWANGFYKSGMQIQIDLVEVIT